MPLKNKQDRKDYEERLNQLKERRKSTQPKIVYPISSALTKND